MARVSRCIRQEASIVLKTAGCHSMKETLEEFEDVRSLKVSKNADRWGWRKTVIANVSSLWPLLLC